MQQNNSNARSRIKVETIVNVFFQAIMHKPPFYFNVMLYLVLANENCSFKHDDKFVDEFVCICSMVVFHQLVYLYTERITYISIEDILLYINLNKSMSSHVYTLFKAVGKCILQWRASFVLLLSIYKRDNLNLPRWHAFCTIFVMDVIPTHGWILT